jgi:hypothetical protein
MMEKLTQAREGGGARPPPFTIVTIVTITYKVAVYAPAEWVEFIATLPPLGPIEGHR